MFSRWNQLQVTYRDPDGMGLPGQKGSEYQAYVELVRVSKTTGTWEKIASFDSNLQCAGGPSLCQADNTTKNFTVDFSHTFDFDNYAYAVYGRLYRALATFSLTPVIYQLRLQAAPIVVQPVSPIVRVRSSNSGRPISDASTIGAASAAVSECCDGPHRVLLPARVCRWVKQTPHAPPAHECKRSCGRRAIACGDDTRERELLIGTN